MSKKFNVLIVDDISENIQMVANTLKEEGYQMAFALNGEDALSHTEAMSFDLILLDIMMPDMDGYEVCERLKKKPETKDIPIIFLTAKTDTESILKGFETGGVDYITKPFNGAELLARVKNHLELKRSREEIEEQKRKIEEQNRKLIEAEKLREDVERISRHDLKNPLNPIIGFSRLLMSDHILSPEQIEYLSIIEQSACQMLEMINLSLDMFKMERGIYQLNPVRLNILEITRKVIAETESLAQAKEVNLLLGSNPSDNGDIFTARGEELLCYSMLSNLIQNAVEASPIGEPVEVSFDQGDMAVISIHNKGAVPEDIRDTFFEKYVTSGKRGGTGLGTYSAKLIAETQGGSIRLDTSEPDETRIIISLPMG